MFNRWQIMEDAKSLEYIEREELEGLKPQEVGTLVLKDFDSAFTFALEDNKWFEVDKKAGTVRSAMASCDVKFIPIVI